MSHSAPLKVAALGGGHGLYATLSAVRQFTENITAIVTVADDGGSSGRIRRELGIIPPGDLRMALAALMPDNPDGAFWAELLQHRMGGGGGFAGHPVGNVILAGLCELLDDPVAALDAMSSKFSILGRVLPMVAQPLEIEADVVGLDDDLRLSRVIRGQVGVATTPGDVRRVRLVPADPPACADAVTAIATADLVTVGPGSWFSSVIPHVLVPGLLTALRETSARRVLLLNLAPQPGETANFTAERHLHVLAAHAEGLRVDDVIVDTTAAAPGAEREYLTRACGLFGATPVFADVAVPGTHQHDPKRVAQVLQNLHYTNSALRDPSGHDSSGNDPSGSAGRGA